MQRVSPQISRTAFGVIILHVLILQSDMETELNMSALGRICQVFPITHRTEVLYREFKQLKLY